jgi:hypothetical protein
MATIGAIQIIRDTLGGGGTGQCHQTTQGGGRRFAKGSRDIFFKIFKVLFFLVFLFSKPNRTLFLEKLKCHVNVGRGGRQSNVTK